MKKFIKLGALLLALLMMLSVFVACNEDDTDDGKNPSGDTGDGSVVFDGEILEMLHWGTTNVTEYVKTIEEANGGLVEENVYYRNVYAMENLNLTVNWTQVNKDNYIESARNAHLSGGVYDTYCMYSQHGASLAIEGLVSNLKTSQYIDFTQPCYPQKLIKDATLFDKLYFMTGDISTNSLFMSSLVYYNKTLYETKKIEQAIQQAYGYDDIYKMVEDGKWTYDTLMALSKGIWEDTDGSGRYSDGDTFGFATYDSVMDNFYYGAGMKTIKSSKTKGLSIAADFKNHNKISTIISTMGTFVKQDENCYSSGNTHVGARTNFGDGRVLFYLAPGSHAYTTFRSVDGLDYGVLPVPKYDAEQDSYGACMSFPYSMYAVSSLSMYPDQSCAFLHELSMQSYKLTRPAIFEQTMKLKYSDKAEDAVMWDMIIESQSYDLGRVFATQLGASDSDQITVTVFRKAISSGDSGWSSLYQSNKKNLDTAIATLNKSLKELEG